MLEADPACQARVEQFKAHLDEGKLAAIREQQQEEKWMRMKEHAEQRGKPVPTEPPPFEVGNFRSRWIEGNASVGDLYREKVAPVGVIALELGFDDTLYFSRRFRQRVGCSASTYRKKYHQAILAAVPPCECEAPLA